MQDHHYDPTEHGLQVDHRSCQCEGCRQHDDWISSDVCARPFLLSREGTECNRCLSAYCTLCAVHCGLCQAAMCRKCDFCTWCECTVCPSCAPKKQCDSCQLVYCDSPDRCAVEMHTCNFCGSSVCEPCQVDTDTFICNDPDCQVRSCRECLSTSTLHPCHACTDMFCPEHRLLRHRHSARPCKKTV